MCSISGVSFAPGSTINRHKLAAALLSEGESRGRDASGFAWVNPTGDGLYKKNVAGGKLNVRARGNGSDFELLLGAAKNRSATRNRGRSQNGYANAQIFIHYRYPPKSERHEHAAAQWYYG